MLRIARSEIPMPGQAHSESEARTRSKRIDPQLEASSWGITPFDPTIRSQAYTRHAVTEYPIGNGPADYALFVDGQVLCIVGMEGDGPLNGTPKATGVLVMGRDPVAVDATCCRLMQLDPH